MGLSARYVVVERSPDRRNLILAVFLLRRYPKSLRIRCYSSQCDIKVTSKTKENILMRNKMLLAVFSVIVILAVAVFPVGAITDGEPDGNGHPFVGLMVAQTASAAPFWGCTGNFISQN